MRFLVPPCALVALLAASAPAQPPGPQIKDGKYVLRIAAAPAAPAVPAFKYTLLPTLRDSRPGNQITGFYKCFLDQAPLFFDKDAAKKRDEWLSAPLADLKGVKELEDYGGTAYRQARRAARMETTDWQVVDDIRDDGIQLLLPDITQFRYLAQVLRVRARGEIARGDFPAAAETIQTHLALARTLNEHPTLIGALVGFAIAATALSSVEEFVAQPGAPNLYWALTDLPAPFFDLRKAVHGERVFFSRDIDTFLDRVNPMSEAQIGRAVTKAAELIDMATLQEGLAPAKGKVELPPRPPMKTTATYLGDRAADPKQVAEARARLMPPPPTRDLRIEKFPPMQVILLDELYKFEASRDDGLKWLSVPYWQVPADAWKSVDGPFAVFTPAMLKVSQSRHRVDQQIGMLRAVEALRAHAAANGGQLPDALDKLRLPLPNDPFTGKPFRYELLNGVGHVRGTPPPERQADAYLNRVYEVEVRR